VLVVFFIIVVAYMIRSLAVFFTVPPVGTETVKIGSIDVPKVISGIIVRDETLYRSPSAGVITYDASENDRLKKGATICTVDDQAQLAALNVQIGQIDDSINKMQDQRQGLSLADDNSQRINAQIKNTFDGKIFSLINSNVSSVYALKDSVSQDIDTRNQAILTDNTGSVKSLADQRQQYQDEVSQYSQPVYAQASGILCETVDGLEETLTPDNMDDLTKEQTLMQVDYGKLAPARNVAENDPMFKLINSNIWYIAAYIPSDMAASYTVGQSASIFVEKDGAYSPLDVEVQYISPAVGGTDTYVIFKCTKNMIDYLYMRSVSLKTSDSVVTGLKIPNTAITEKTMLSIPKAYVTADKPYKVYKKDGDTFTEITVSIFDEEDGSWLIPAQNGYLEAGDAIANPNDHSDVMTISQTETMRGVYRVNDGTAEFRSITVASGDMTNSGYTILNPDTANIKAYDSIVSDAASVTDGEIIY